MRYAEIPLHLRDRPFTTAEALAAGLTHRQLQSPVWRRIFHDVHVHVAVPDTLELRLEAIKLTLPPYAVVCNVTAAWLYGADVRREDDLDVHIAFPKGARRRPQAGLVVSQETLAPDDVVLIGGVRVTSPVRTTFDCLRLLRGMDRLVVADAMTHIGRTTVDELRTYWKSQRRLRNLRIAELLLDDIEPKSESPTETRLRVTLLSRGLPRPVAQWEVFRPDCTFVARLDLAYPEARVAVEYDGAWHWQGRRADDRRRDALRALGWVVIVVSADDLYQQPDAVCTQVRAALRRHAAAASSAT